MQLYNLIRQGPPLVLRQIVAMSVVSGVASVALLAIVNTVTGRADGDTPPGLGWLLAYLAAFAVFFASERFALSRCAILMEGLLKDLRLRVADRLRRAELTVIEGIDRGELYTTLSQEPNQISQTFQYTVNAVQQIVMLAICLFYIAWVSLAAFGVIVAATVVLVVLYRRLRAQLDPALGGLMASNAEVVRTFDDLIDGFKEIRVDSRKSDALFRSLVQTSERSRKRKVAVAEIAIVVMTYGNVFLYGLLLAVVFVLPQYVSGFSGIVQKMIAVTLFTAGPVAYVMGVSPFITRADLCLQRLYDLEARLSQAPDPDALERARRYGEQFSTFTDLTYDNISFTYRDETEAPTFTVGPLDVRVARGETIFLTGGNGSGKSTLLKLLTALYPTNTGCIEIDGRPVAPKAVGGLRELYGCIFADFHLFDRLYGLEQVEPERVTALLQKMEIERKVTFENGRFSTLNLSTGQRKRLALVEALLEDKPIYVFDEWAADQDVHFRRIFYEEILEELRAQGKTVIAATHDDRYWHVADRIIKLDAGRLVDAGPVEKGTQP